MLSEVGTQIFWVPIFFKKFITNFRQGITKEEGDFLLKERHCHLFSKKYILLFK